VPVSADLQPVLDAVASRRAARDDFDLAEYREYFRVFCTSGRHLAAEVAEVVDRTLPGPDGELPVRVYRVDGLGDSAPVVLYLHGGGWTVGDLEGYDEQCRAVAAASGAVVVAVEYRLAPEHPFPAAVEDSWAALCWVSEHAADLGVDPERLVVAGDSAGGNLTAVVALMARDRGGPTIAHQFLIYPATDFDYESGRWPSLEENAEGYVLELATMRWYAANLAGGRDPVTDPLSADPLAAPIRAADHSGLAPATVTVAGFDPLRDEGLAYAEVLRDAGVPTEVVHHAEQVHGYWIFAPLVPSSGSAREVDLAVLRDVIAALPSGPLPDGG